MDIARLPSIGHITPSYPVPTRGVAGHERVLELVSDTAAASPVRDPREKVVQGELLQRQRTAYGSTHDYLNSRLFDGTGNPDADTDPGQPDRALGAYLSHTRELIQPDINRGKQVDYFI